MINNKDGMISIRVSGSLQKQFKEFCFMHRYVINQLITDMYLKAIQKGKIPFDAAPIPYSYQKDEIQKRVAIRVPAEAKLQFAEICKLYGKSQAYFIKSFMFQCIQENCNILDKKKRT